MQLSELIKRLREIEKEDGDMEVGLGFYVDPCNREEYQLDDIRGIEVCLVPTAWGKDAPMKNKLRIQSWVE